MVNVTMLVCNRPKLTAQALASLGKPDGFNVTISQDSKCDAETRNIVQRWYSERYTGKGIFEAPTAGTGGLRNFVINQSIEFFSRGDYLYLSDNDVFFYPAIFEKLVPIYEYAWTLGFRVLGAYSHPFHRPIASIPVYGGWSVIISRINELQALPLQSMLMKWEVYDKYGPFVDTPVGRVCMGEDIAFTNKIRADGFRIGVVDPPLVVNTGLTNSFGEKIPGWEVVLKECPAGVFCE